jgi:hypothetical protein
MHDETGPNKTEAVKTGYGASAGRIRNGLLGR